MVCCVTKLWWSLCGEVWNMEGDDDWVSLVVEVLGFWKCLEKHCQEVGAIRFVKEEVFHHN